MDFNPGDNERWYVDTVAPPNSNLPDPMYQQGYFRGWLDNNGEPWVSGDSFNIATMQAAHSGHGFVGIDLESDWFTREGIQTQTNSDCPLNTGLYAVDLWWARAYQRNDVRFYLSLSDQASNRRRIVADHGITENDHTAGEWNLYSTVFTLDPNNPDDIGNTWFSITGKTSVSSFYREYTYFDDVRLYRPCDDLLRCNRTHGQICPTIATMLPPDDLLAVHDIDNVLDVHLVISNTLQQSLLDTTWHNANGFTEFRLARTNLPAQMATGNYPYTLTLSNDCGATKHAGTIRVADTALYTLTPPWTDSTANWSPMPIPCCLDSLSLRNITLRGNVSYIVRDQITVQSGVSIAPGSNVILQAGNVTEIDKVLNSTGARVARRFLKFLVRSDALRTGMWWRLSATIGATGFLLVRLGFGCHGRIRANAAIHRKFEAQCRNSYREDGRTTAFHCSQSIP
ncbi:MAG: hypothetical protein U0176_24715 [Bacteroidia bacterium]